MMKIGFAGLGAMGGPMAGHLLDAGHTLYVLTRRREFRRTPRSPKARSGPRRRKTSRRTRNSYSPSFPARPRSKRSWPAKTACAPGSRLEPRISIAPRTRRRWRRELSADLAKIGVSMLDAPVSGGTEGCGFPKTRDLGQRRASNLRRLQTDP